MVPADHKIELLPEHIIDQIKAGEVVERPANLIKEIVENALDAKADRLDLHLVGEGMDLISLSDNGEGINYDDLPLAFCRHATSKISRFDDLYRLSTFGFRGEALASISAISHLTCLSQRPGKKSGGKVTLEGGKLTSHSKEVLSHQQGTSLYIKDLFYNTPARLKFVKSKSSEKTAINKIVESFIISHPAVNFSVKWDDDDKIIYKSTQNNLDKRVEQVFHKSKKDTAPLINFTQEFEGHHVEGFLTTNSVRSHSQRKQFLFVNGRLFYDKQIHGLLCRVMDSRGWFQGSGSYCLFITAPPSQIDVNVHPSKTTIKFLKHSTLLSMISNSLKQILRPSMGKSEGMSEVLEKTPTPLESYDAHSSSHSPLYMNGQFSFPEKSSEGEPITSKRSSLFESQHDSLQILTLNDQSFLFHKVNFIKDIFSSISQLSLEENYFTPLLISEPLISSKVPYNENDISELKKYGFLIEKIDDEMFVARAVYHGFISNQTAQLINLLKEHQYSPGLIEKIDFILTPSLVEHLLNDPSLQVQQRNFMLPLFDIEVERLFNTK